MSIENKGIGWRPDPEDDRDFVYGAPKKIKAAVKPAKFIQKMELQFDQGPANSCVGNGVSSLIWALHILTGLSKFTASRLFIYYNARKMIGEQNQDNGCVIRDAIKSINTEGACSEGTWAYDLKKLRTAPDSKSYVEGEKHQSIRYEKINRNIEDMKTCLFEGYPFVLGFRVPKSFSSPETRKTGIIKTPTATEPLNSGHCMVAIGWDDSLKALICQNSYGPNWGDKGKAYLSYAAINNPKWSGDFWTIREIEGEKDTPVEPPKPKACKCGNCPSPKCTCKPCVTCQRP